MGVREAAKYVGGLALAILLLGWFLRGTELGEVGHQLAGVSIVGLLGATVAMVFQNVFRVWRWRALLEPVRPGIAFRPMFDATILGYMTSWLVPGRLGEVVRPALLSGREGLPLGACLGSVVADRVLDGISVVVLFAIGLATTPLDGPAARHAVVIRSSSLVILVAVLVPMIALMAASAGRARFEARAETRGGLLGWLLRSVFAVASGLDALRRPRLLGRIVVHTSLGWLLVSLGTWIGIRACGADISFGAVLVIQPLLALGIALPTPGGAGGYHAAMKFGLVQLFAVSEPVAVGAGLMLHAVSVVPIVLLGALILTVDRLPFRDLMRAARRIRDLGAVENSP